MTAFALEMYELVSVNLNLVALGLSILVGVLGALDWLLKILRGKFGNC